VAIAATRTNLLLALAWLGAAAGTVLSVLALLERPPAAPEQLAAAKAGGQRVATSFGSMSVDYVVRLTGDRVPMGVRVGRGELPIQVGVTLVNVSERPLRFDPAMLRLPGAARGAVDVGRLPGGAVEPRGAHRFVLRYAVPNTATLPTLRFRDPGRRAAVGIPLGRRAAMGLLNVASHDFSARPIKP
jgi:hypothetical protein